MATPKDERPHLILVTLDTCVQSQNFLKLWNQLIVDSHVASKFQFNHIARPYVDDSLPVGQPPAVYHGIIRWFPWLMLIDNSIWPRLHQDRIIILTSKLFNGKFCKDNSSNNIVTPTLDYPNTYMGILTWLRHCHDNDPTVFPYIRIEAPYSYLHDIPTTAPRLALSPFWAAAYRDRNLPFASDSRKVIGSSYLDELKKRQVIVEPSTHPDKFSEYQSQMKPILTELQLLGLTDYFNLDQPPSNYIRLIQRHLDLLIDPHTL